MKALGAAKPRHEGLAQRSLSGSAQPKSAVDAGRAGMSLLSASSVAAVSPLRGERPAGGRRDFVPTAESLFFASPKKRNQKKGDPTAAAPAGLLCAAQAGRETQKLALRAQTSAFLFPPRLALLDAAHGTRRENTSDRLVWLRQTLAFPVRVEDFGPEAIRTSSTARAKRSELFVGVGPRVRRRAAQARPDQEVQMFEPAGRVSELPGWDEQRRAAPQGPAQSGRLFFAYFLLAKQKKVSALSGAHPDAASHGQKNRPTNAIGNNREGGHA